MVSGKLPDDLERRTSVNINDIPRAHIIHQREMVSLNRWDETANETVTRPMLGGLPERMSLSLGAEPLSFNWAEVESDSDETENEDGSQCEIDLDEIIKGNDRMDEVEEAGQFDFDALDREDSADEFDQEQDMAAPMDFSSVSIDSKYGSNDVEGDFAKMDLNLMKLGEGPGLDADDLMQAVQRAEQNRWIRAVHFTNDAARNPHLSDVENQLVTEVAEGLRYRMAPVEIEEGVTGAFFMKKLTHGFCAVFKSEEIINPRNRTTRFASVHESQLRPGKLFEHLDGANEAPSDFTMMASKQGLRVGMNESCVREVAAYLLDHDRFARVPETAMVRISARAFGNLMNASASPSSRSLTTTPRPALGLAKSFNAESISDFLSQEDKSHFVDYRDVRPGAASLTPASKEHMRQRARIFWKTGSLQKYVEHDIDANDIGSASFDVDMVHKIGIFDIRTLNPDRHEGNVLIKFKNSDDYRSKASLTPIDHGFILPDFECFNLDGDANLCWMGWPQSNLKFSSEVKKYIRSLDAESDCDMLQSLLGNRISLRSLRSLKIGTLVLKIGVLDYDLSLSQLGSLLLPFNAIQEVPLNRVIQEARNESDFHDPGMGEDRFFQAFSKKLKTVFDDMLSREQ